MDDRADTSCTKVSDLGVLTEFGHAYDIQRILKGFMQIGRGITHFLKKQKQVE